MAATLAFVGDIMLGRMVDAQIGLRPPESFWGSALSVLRRAAAVFGNLECAVSDRGVAHGRVRKAFAFRARPAAVDVLRAGGIRWVSLANNHVLDYGDEALLDTLRHLDDAGIAHAGAGPTLAAAQRRSSCRRIGGRTWSRRRRSRSAGSPGPPSTSASTFSTATRPMCSREWKRAPAG